MKVHCYIAGNYYLIYNLQVYGFFYFRIKIEDEEKIFTSSFLFYCKFFDCMKGWVGGAWGDGGG